MTSKKLPTAEKAAKPPVKTGQRTKYTPALAELICKRIAAGQSLRAVCASDPKLPHEATVRGWALEDREGFAEMFERARALGCYAIADQLLEIADDARNDWMKDNGRDDAGWLANGENVQRSRLRVDTRKWLLSKLLPQRFGDRIEQIVSGPNGAPLAAPTFVLNFVPPPPVVDEQAKPTTSDPTSGETGVPL